MADTNGMATRQAAGRGRGRGRKAAAGRKPTAPAGGDPDISAAAAAAAAPAAEEALELQPTAEASHASPRILRHPPPPAAIASLGLLEDTKSSIEREINRRRSALQGADQPREHPEPQLRPDTSKQKVHPLGGSDVEAETKPATSISQHVRQAAAAIAEQVQDTAADVRDTVADARADILLRLTPARLALAAALFWLLLFGGIAATLWLLRRQPLLEQASGLEALRKDLDTATAAYVLVERQVRDTLAGQQRTADRLEETLSKLEQLERSWQATLTQEEGNPVSAEEAALPPFRAVHALQQSRQDATEAILMAAEQRAAEVAQHKVDLLQADGTGMADYALHSAGGRVISHSRLYSKARVPWWFKLRQALAQLLPAVFPQPLHPQASQLILMPRGPPGLCLSLDGSRARVEVALRCPIVPTAFTLEHIPRNISFERGSAPRLVAMFGSLAAPLHSPERDALGAATDAEGVELLGRFEYKINDDQQASTPALQTFALTADRLVDRVAIEIEDNYGAAYTCIYRIQVHGEPLSDLDRSNGR